MIRATVNIDPFDPSEDMEYEIGLLDYGGKTNKNVSYVINEDMSGIILDSFELNGLKLHVKERMSYEPWNYGRANKGSGQVGAYKLETPNGKLYFAVIKDYIASEGDWRIALVNIRENDWELRSWLQTNGVYGFTLSAYAFGRLSTDNVEK
jgi:hypothetical protein